MAQLNDLIQENIKQANKSYEQTIEHIEQRSETIRLWIHVQKEEQKKLGEQIFKAISDTSIQGKSFTKKPLRVVNFGPEKSELRYFKEEDKSDAAELFSVTVNL